MSKVLLKLYLIVQKEVTTTTHFNFLMAFFCDINYIIRLYSQKTC
jgi:hypothetical protein